MSYFRRAYNVTFSVWFFAIISIQIIQNCYQKYYHLPVNPLLGISGLSAAIGAECCEAIVAATAGADNSAGGADPTFCCLDAAGEAAAAPLREPPPTVPPPVLLPPLAPPLELAHEPVVLLWPEKMNYFLLTYIIHTWNGKIDDKNKDIQSEGEFTLSKRVQRL